MRVQFGKSLYELAKADARIVLIVGDIGYKIFDDFIKAFPRRYFNVGTCEQSMVSMAAGMALQGYRPVVYTITPFLIERAFEQIKIDVHAQQAPVGLVGYADYPTQGITHQELNAKALMALVPNIQSYFPKNSHELAGMMQGIIDREKPYFISLKQNPQ